MTRVTILGSTGSIGTQALEVVAAHPDRFEVVGLAAGRNHELLVEQARRHNVRWIAVGDAPAAGAVRAALPHARVSAGPEGIEGLAEVDTDVVVNGLVGSRGLRPTLAALAAGHRVALANKESLILGGELVLRAVTRRDQLVPVDSEHSALAQCLRAGAEREVERLIVTASGGPFRGRTRTQLAEVTPADALRHPTWQMGDVITVNSATLANKGLEVIEAHLLFSVPYDRIEVVVQPQSIVHGLVEFRDGAVVAKLSPPDMRLPIQLALGWPERLEWAPARLDWRHGLRLDFEPLDAETFPMIGLAVAAGRAGGATPGMLNAANEEAVAAFLGHRLDFLGIPAVVEATLEEHTSSEFGEDLEGILAAEEWARRRARDHIKARHAPTVQGSHTVVE